MPKLVWDATGARYYHTGVSNGVLYKMNAGGTYSTGVVWNGLTQVEEKPEGADAQDLYADNIKYASFRTAENYKGTISAYSYPDDWEECDGSKSVAPGMVVGQQKRSPFGLVYRTEVGNDANSNAYILHIVYNATANPSSKSHQTINENPDAVEFSWDFETTPVGTTITGIKTTATIEVDSRTADATKLATLEGMLFGTEGAGSEHEATLPDPDTVYATLKTT